MMNGIHITHNDADAVGCALVASLCFPDVHFDTRFVRADVSCVDKLIQDMILDSSVDYEYILITDLSMSEEMAYQLEGYRRKMERNNRTCVLKGIDHHASNLLGNLHDWYTVESGDMSAAWLLWQDEYPEKECNLRKMKEFSVERAECFELLIEFISRYDTWLWKREPKFFKELENTPAGNLREDCVSNMCKLYPVEEVYRILKDYYEYGEEENFSEKNMMIIPREFIFYSTVCVEAQREKAVLNIEREAKLFYCNDLFTEYNVISIICGKNDDVNAIAEHLYTRYTWADFILILFPHSQIISFRTNKNDVNVGRIAKRLFKGGGHPQSAGANLSIDMEGQSEFCKLLNSHIMYSSSIAEFYEELCNSKLEGLNPKIRDIAEAENITGIQEEENVEEECE